MTWLAAAAVRTTGVNWESVAAITGIVAVIMTVVLWIFNRRDKRQEEQNNELRHEFTRAINNLSDVLLAKLETKEAVAQISVRLARVEGAAGIASNTSR